jgi:hydroxymethylpyrimidine pyrophosphatase-like HAD family hydrolase
LRLAAIDLDGTLLRSDGTISQRSRAAIRAVRDGASWS